MKKMFIVFMLFVNVFFIFTGCTCQSWYEGLKEAERQKCYQIESPTERQACLDRVDEKSYIQYQQEREETKKQ